MRNRGFDSIEELQEAIERPLTEKEINFFNNTTKKEGWQFEIFELPDTGEKIVWYASGIKYGLTDEEIEERRKQEEPLSDLAKEKIIKI